MILSDKYVNEPVVVFPVSLSFDSRSVLHTPVPDMHWRGSCMDSCS